MVCRVSGVRGLGFAYAYSAAKDQVWIPSKVLVLKRYNFSLR